jgi:hypothetical protein
MTPTHRRSSDYAFGLWCQHSPAFGAGVPLAGHIAASQVALVYESASPAMSPEVAAQLRLLRPYGALEEGRQQVMDYEREDNSTSMSSTITKDFTES